MMQRQTSLQDTFLTRARRAKSPVTVFLMNGYQLRGIITGFDSFAVVLVSDGKQPSPPSRPYSLCRWRARRRADGKRGVA